MASDWPKFERFFMFLDETELIPDELYGPLEGCFFRFVSKSQD